MSDFQRAFALFQRGDLAGAERDLRELLRLFPGHGDGAHLLAGVLQAKGDLEGALAQFARAGEIAPNDPSIAFNHAQVLIGAGRHEEALAPHARAVALAPSDPEAALAYGLSLAALKRPEEALAQFERARAAAPRNPAAHYNAGVALSALDRFEEAITAYDAALALNPRHLDARANRGVAHAALRNFDLAIADASAVAAQAPADAVRNRQLGLALLEADRFEEGRAALLRAAALASDDIETGYALAMIYLAEGDYARGLPLYEERWRVSTGPRRRPVSAKVWAGDSEIAGQTVLVRGEQGIGDALMFARFVPALAARGARVIVQERASLLGLLRGVEGVADVVDEREPAPPHDLFLSLGSAPLALAARIETLPQPPYLVAEAPPVAAWRVRLGPAMRKRIGLAWRGAGGNRQAQRRDLPLDALEHLLGADADFVSLQMNDGDAGPLLARAGARSFGEDVRDFCELAALIAALDLVITVDTSVAHLAGALGAPTWVLLPRPCDWRWLRERADSPWYPSARLFRQSAPGDWRSAIGEVRAAL